VTISSIVVCSS